MKTETLRRFNEVLVAKWERSTVAAAARIIFLLCALENITGRKKKVKIAAEQKGAKQFSLYESGPQGTEGN